MRLWWEVARRSFRRHSTYRAALFAGVFTNTVFGFLKTYVLIAVYDARDGAPINGFDVTDVVTFSWLAQGFWMLAMQSHLELAERIRTGDVVGDLYRPADLQLWWLSSEAGRIAFQILVRSFVPTVVGGLFFHLRLPTSPAVWIAFAVSVALAMVVGFAHRFIVSLTTFWVLSYMGTSQLAMILIGFFSGMFVPITLFPDWLGTIARWTPYPAMLQLPIEVLLGKATSASELAALFAAQVAWAVVLLAAGRWLLAAAQRKVVVQGG
ncbi:MAG TPA: ABC-2 family transporter protein [Acidimicrobiales bacterium]